MPNDGPKIVGTVCAALITLIVGFEGVVTHAYRDAGGVPTVCVGHTEGVKMEDQYTKAQCWEILAADIPKYERFVNKCVHVPFPPKRRMALIDLAFNVGGGGFCRSDAVRLLNAGDVVSGCNAIIGFRVTQPGVKGPLKGLIRRRKAESALCLQED